MKKNILLLFSAVILSATFALKSNAQSDSEDIDLFQSIFGMEKKAVVADFLELEENAPFWAIYDEYETARKVLGKERIYLLTAYAENYDKNDDATYDATINSIISLRKQNDKLLDKYYKKVKKVSGSKVAAQFFQVEAYFISEIRAAILEEIPYFGEFDN